MPQFRLPFRSYPIAVTTDETDISDYTFEIPNAKQYASNPAEVIGRADKTYFVLSDRALTADIYVVPYKDAIQSDWLLYKKNLVINANDPYIFFSNDVYPFVAIVLKNASGAKATVKGWLFCQ